MRESNDQAPDGTTTLRGLLCKSSGGQGQSRGPSIGRCALLLSRGIGEGAAHFSKSRRSAADLNLVDIERSRSVRDQRGIHPSRAKYAQGPSDQVPDGTAGLRGLPLRSSGGNADEKALRSGPCTLLLTLGTAASTLSFGQYPSSAAALHASKLESSWSSERWSRSIGDQRGLHCCAVPSEPRAGVRRSSTRRTSGLRRILSKKASQ